MDKAGFSIESLAEAIGTTPKSVWRWRNGVVPRRVDLRSNVLRVLGMDAAELWPAGEDSAEVGRPDAGEEIVAAWAHRSDAPRDTWWLVLHRAEHEIDLLGYALQFLPEDSPSFDRLLVARAREGYSVRIALADPDSRLVAERDHEERLGGTLPARIRTTVDHFKPLFGVGGIELRYHRTPMYNSVVRADEQMLVMTHLFGLKGYKAPMLHLRSLHDDGLFDNYVAHFERVWSTAVPMPPP
ncbi:MAG: helix-turn-helix domain-containing protein [Acidimicrobiales bacterium]